MDKRTKNRLNEHSGKGHNLNIVTNHPSFRQGQSLQICDCGWRGWLDNQ